MKYLSSFSTIIFLISFSAPPLAAADSHSIEEAVHKGFVKLVIKSKGGYTGEVIRMRILNTSGHDLHLRLEAGRRLDSKTVYEQDILITKAAEIFVKAGQQMNVNVWGMCCQAHNACPHENALYSEGKIADSALVHFAEFIDENRYYSEYAAQQGVWVISDRNSIGSIEGGDSMVVNRIRAYVSKITGRPVPKYKVTYGNGTFTDVLGNATKIEGTIEYSLSASMHVTVAIYDSNGKKVQRIMEDMASGRGVYKIYYTFRTRALPAGTYYARMTDAAGVIRKEEEIVF